MGMGETGSAVGQRDMPPQDRQEDIKLRSTKKKRMIPMSTKSRLDGKEVRI